MLTIFTKEKIIVSVENSYRATVKDEKRNGLTHY